MKLFAKFIFSLVGIFLSFSTGCDRANKTGEIQCDVISICVRAYDPRIHDQTNAQPSFYKIGGVDKIYRKGDSLEYLFNDSSLGVGGIGEKALITKLIQIKSAKIINITNPTHYGGATGPAVAQELDAKYPWILDAGNDEVCKREIDRLRNSGNH